ncbi:BMP-binding endothelial regulator protein [Phlebotomus argentipes]|uniref:BMP-binding endothelial regulator protein n=1 Tax=Phlebotomus argentipes TaxID=94469 RepID=UPI00289363BA|nr:BMP-binding endothelial regulator protein [Phlebotomus argentipes]
MDRRVLVTWMLTLIFLTSISTVNAAESIMGKRIPCTNEGEEISVDAIPDGHCYRCICLNGFVECNKDQCPSVDDCYMLIKRPPGGCCAKCKECLYRGKTYASGTEWTDPEDPCASFKCVAGIVTESNIQCYTPCADPFPPRPGQCCPTCIGCLLNGQRVDEGREVTLREDPCLKCQCSGKRLTCVKKACPVLQCPVSKQIKMPGECCPRCTERRESLQVSGGKCFLGKGTQPDKTKFEADPCSPCVCTNGTSICRRTTCPVLECPPEMQYQKPDSCCPSCPPPTMELQSVCSHNGTVYQNNDTWDLSPCAACRCHHGTVRCTQTKCPETKCRPNHTLVTPPGQCCAKCEETAGICTVFGDPHYKTFDGKFFSFQGSCKYQLTADCAHHTFSIRVTNDARGTRFSSWTKTVTLKMGETKVNLGQKMRVKVNGTRVKPPYRVQDVLSVNMTEDGVVVDTALGIRLLWDGANYLQVQAAVKFKGRLCGLCGNYNGVSRDDLKGRPGTNISDDKVWRIANSWRVGGRKACGRQGEKGRRGNMNRGRRRWGMCRELRDNSRVFGSCVSHLNPSNYYDSCRQDMSECPTEQCYCDSFTAYAHECGRLGVEPPNWRHEANCMRQDFRSVNAKPLPPQELELIQRHTKRTRKPHSQEEKLRKHIPKGVRANQHRSASVANLPID